MSDQTNFIQFFLQWLTEFFQTPQGILLVSLLTIIGTIITIVTLRDWKKISTQPAKKPFTDESLTPTSNFTAQLGNPQNPGLLSKEQRLVQIQSEQNPYVCGAQLPGNSAVFYGRGYELGSILSVLGNPNKPGNVSILGERRIGKSSLLNQIKQVLAQVSKLVTIHTTMQNWSVDSQATFFTQLHQAICDALKIASGFVDNYAGFRDFIQHYAEQGYRFVLIIDEFDKMTDNTYFDATFFSNMRTLGECSEYQFAYILASYTPLFDICYQEGIKESKFWNIFGTCHTLGLLFRKEAEQLIQEPMQRSLKRTFADAEREAILAYAGYHPAFLQIVVAEYWKAYFLNCAPNQDAIQQTLHYYYQDLWQHRSKEERQLLLQIAQNEIPEDSSTLSNLRRRGLIDDDNKLFARFFAQFTNNDMDDSTTD